MSNEEVNNNYYRGGGLLGFILLVFAIWWIWGHWLAKPTWTATFYPDAGNLTISQSYQVDSLEGCRDWVDTQALLLGVTDYDYECGTNCELKANPPGISGQYYICDETFE